MIIYGYTPKTWKDKAVIYWGNTNKKLFTLFVNMVAISMVNLNVVCSFKKSFN